MRTKKQKWIVEIDFMSLFENSYWRLSFLQKFRTEKKHWEYGMLTVGVDILFV